MSDVVFIGFDSAWTDSVRAPGAICAVRMRGGTDVEFHLPRNVNFAQALCFIDAITDPSDLVLVAIDQPTIVRNATGMRPAERVAASVISWAGGGVQPANRGRIGMFDDSAPIWRFLAKLGASDDPLRARTADRGRFVMEVFPALALLSMNEQFFGRRQAPKYNPANPNFRKSDWAAVVRTVAFQAHRLRLPKLMLWANTLHFVLRPSKAQQDKLDAAICLLIAIVWRTQSPAKSMMIGDLVHGHIVVPMSCRVRSRLRKALS